MDHACYKCGHNILEGKPFCSECGAPQIRVMLPEVSAAPLLGGDLVSAAQSSESNSDFPVIAAAPYASSWSRDFRPCAFSAAIALVLTFVGLNPFAAAFTAGVLALVFSQRGAQRSLMRTADGARLGATSGFLLFGMSTIFEMLAIVLLHRGSELRNEMLDKLHQAASRYPASEVQPFLDFVRSPEGFAAMVVASVIFGLVAFVLLGGLGGALGTAFVRRRPKP